MIDLILEYVKAATGLPDSHVIIGNQAHNGKNTPIPKTGQFATVLLITEQNLGQDWQVMRDSGIEGRLDSFTTGPRETAWSVQIYRDDALATGRKLIQYAFTPDGQYLLAQSKLAWREAGDLLQTDTLNTAGVWEHRASVT